MENEKDEIEITVTADPANNQAKWKCEGCGISGVVPMPKHWDVWGVMTSINIQHAEKAPNCDSIEQYPNND